MKVDQGMDYSIEKFEKHNDLRGQLVVFLKNSNLSASMKEFGQIYFVTFDGRGVVRGNHYHKRWREWFGVVSGKLSVELMDLSTGETVSLVLDGDSDDYIRLEIGPNIVHAFCSLTPMASLLNYTDTEWAPLDTFSYELTKTDEVVEFGI